MEKKMIPLFSSSLKHDFKLKYIFIYIFSMIMIHLNYINFHKLFEY